MGIVFGALLCGAREGLDRRSRNGVSGCWVFSFLLSQTTVVGVCIRMGECVLLLLLRYLDYYASFLPFACTTVYLGENTGGGGGTLEVVGVPFSGLAFVFPHFCASQKGERTRATAVPKKNWSMSVSLG